MSTTDISHIGHVSRCLDATRGGGSQKQPSAAGGQDISSLLQAQMKKNRGMAMTS